MTSISNQINSYHPLIHSTPLPSSNEKKTQRIALRSISQDISAQGIIRYFADGAKFNADNPHLIRSSDKVKKIYTASSSCKKILTNPDSHKKIGHNNKLAPVCVTNGKIELGTWLKMKLSNTCWQNDGDVRDTLPRVILGILYEGNQEKIKIVNDFLKNATPFTTKSKGWTDFKSLFHSNDDFTITLFTRILYQFGNDPSKIFPETKKNILKNLLTLEGQRFHDRIPNTAGYGALTALVGYDANISGISNTENHVLMINGSAYLKNKYMKDVLRSNEAKYENRGSDLETNLANYLDDLYENGLIEFNSIPYSGYTVDALLNLYDFGDEPIKSKSGKVLDLIFTSYALHSTPQGQSFRPFGRQYVKAANKDFIKDDSIRAFISPWLNQNLEFYRTKDTTKNSIFALTALTTTYRPPEFVLSLLQADEGFLSMTGHRFGCSEISYKGTSKHQNETARYLISGGGNRQNFTLNPCKIYTYLEQRAREVISRPISLIVEDNYTKTQDLTHAIFLGRSSALKGENNGKDSSSGPGIESIGRNNSGTYHNFACGACPVQIPKELNPVYVHKDWSLYEPVKGLTIAVYSKNDLGMFAIYPSTKASKALAEAISKNNPHPNTCFSFPLGFRNIMEGSIVHFDTHADLNEWVIKGVTPKGKHKIEFSKKKRNLNALSPRGQLERSADVTQQTPLKDMYPDRIKKHPHLSVFSWISRLFVQLWQQLRQLF